LRYDIQTPLLVETFQPLGCDDRVAREFEIVLVVMVHRAYLLDLVFNLLLLSLAWRAHPVCLVCVEVVRDRLLLATIVAHWSQATLTLVLLDHASHHNTKINMPNPLLHSSHLSTF
jgi:hypothetical protein